MKRTLALVALLGLTTACMPEEKKQDATPKREAAGVAEATTSASVIPEAQAAPATAGGRVAQYTNLKTCKTLEENPDEAWATLSCTGLGGYNLKILAGDSREDLAVLPPGGEERAIEMSTAVGNSGFNSLGDTVEWRGVNVGGKFKPDSMVVRFRVSTDPNYPEKITSYLLAVSLTKDKPCITKVILPGPGQNEQARAAADAPGACLV